MLANKEGEQDVKDDDEHERDLHWIHCLRNSQEAVKRKIGA
jgi:hypothetical protein